MMEVAPLCLKEQVMGKLKDVVIKKFASLQPLKPLTSEINDLIEQFLCNFTSNSHTPDHPTYALMIHRAIVELNEEEGSSEEAISKFIKAEQKDLPFAHSSLLSYHIKKNCERGEIVCTSNMCYMLPVAELKQLKQKRRQRQCMGSSKQSKAIEVKQNEVTGVENQSKNQKNEDHIEQTVERDHRIEDLDSKNQLQERLVEQIGEEKKIEVNNEQSHGEELEIEIIGGHAQEHGIFEVIDEQNEARGHEMQCHNQSQERGELVGEQQQEQAAPAEEQWIGVLEGKSQAHWQQLQEVEDQKQTEEQEAEVIKEQNQPEEQWLQLQEIETEVVEDNIKSQGQQNEVIENKNIPQGQQIEGQSMVNDLRNMLNLILEKQDEAGTVATVLLGSSLASQKLHNICSFVSLKEFCVKLLKSSATFQYQLVKIIDSLSETEESNHNTLKHVMDEEKEIEIEHVQQSPNLIVERPMELEATTAMQSCQTQQWTQGPPQPELTSSPQLEPLSRPQPEPSNMGAPLTSDHQNHEQPQPQPHLWTLPNRNHHPWVDPPLEQPHGRGRGRPCKSKPAASTGMEASLPLQHQKLEQKLVSRGQGRPPKRKFDAVTAEELLISPNPQQQPKRRGRGRPPKVKSRHLKSKNMFGWMQSKV